MSYYLKAFGFVNFQDLFTTLFCKANIYLSAGFSLGIATATAFIGDVTGFNLGAFLAFLFLILAEWHTGLKVARIVRGEKIKSRKVGRMIIKIGVYTTIISILNGLSNNVKMPPLFDLEINPLEWLYYVAILFIVFQLIVSYLENLGKLGYNEAGRLSKFFKGKMSSWLEIDGDKSNNEFDEKK